MTNDREIKFKIRELKKLKKDLKVGTQIRRDINKQIREFKKELTMVYNADEEKLELIRKINNIYKHYTDLTKFSKEQLQKHLDLIIKEKGSK